MKYYQKIFLLTAGFTLLWQFSIMLFRFPAFILPPPLAVLKILGLQSELLAKHGLITLAEIGGGLCLGATAGATIAIMMMLSRLLRSWLRPLLIISQSIPTFAIAPILIFWLGYGISSKLVITAFMIFFPVASNFFDGLQRTPRQYLDLAQTMNANHWQILRQIRIPAALPAFASGLRIAAAIAPIGAIIGEWVGASQGLGFLMLEANGRMQIDLVFAILTIIILFSILFYTFIDKLLTHYISW